MKKTKTNEKIAMGVKTVVSKMADVSCGAASMWGLYQAKEPQKFIEVKESKKA